MSKENLLRRLSEPLISDTSTISSYGGNLKHEVFNPKCPHFLDFDYYVEDSEAPKGLLTTTKITHGLRLTGNGMVYLPSQLSAAIPSLIDPYPVPVKGTHRDANGSREVPVIGRVVGGRYIHDTGKYSNAKIDVRKFKDLNPREPRTRATLKALYQTGMLTDANYEGEGYVLVKSVITDRESIEKILDKRFLSVSVEMKPIRGFINSITGNNFAEDVDAGIDYDIMDIVDGAPAILIPDGLQFEGYAYVTHPADRHALNLHSIEVGNDELKSYLDTVFSSKSYVMDWNSNYNSGILDSEIESFLKVKDAIVDYNVSNSDKNDKDIQVYDNTIDDTESETQSTGDETMPVNIEEVSSKLILDSDFMSKLVELVTERLPKPEPEVTSTEVISIEDSEEMKAARSTISDLSNDLASSNAALDLALKSLSDFIVAVKPALSVIDARFGEVEDSAPVEELRRTIIDLIPQVNLEALSAKLNPMNKEPVEPATFEDSADSNINSSKSSEFNANQVGIAQSFKSLKTSNRIADASSLWSRAVREGIIPQGVTAQQILDSVN